MYLKLRFFTAHSDDDIEVTSAFKIARTGSQDFGGHHGGSSLLKPSLSSLGPPMNAATPPYGLGPSHSPMGLPGHEHLGGFHPSMLLNAQLALQAAMAAAAMGVSSAGTASIFSSPLRSTPGTPVTTLESYLAKASGFNGTHSESGTLHSMEKMVAGINGTSGSAGAAAATAGSSSAD